MSWKSVDFDDPQESAGGSVMEKWENSALVLLAVAGALFVAWIAFFAWFHARALGLIWKSELQVDQPNCVHATNGEIIGQDRDGTFARRRPFVQKLSIPWSKILLVVLVSLTVAWAGLLAWLASAIVDLIWGGRASGEPAARPSSDTGRPSASGLRLIPIACTPPRRGPEHQGKEEAEREEPDNHEGDQHALRVAGHALPPDKAARLVGDVHGGTGAWAEPYSNAAKLRSPIAASALAWNRP
jgi:hypothetical protein